MANLRGETIGPYKIVGSLSNHGGMAGVYEGRIIKDYDSGRENRHVALKISYVDNENADIFEQMLIKETQFLHDYRHPGIVRLVLTQMGRENRHRVMYGRADNLEGQPFYFAMELLQGGTLAENNTKKNFDEYWKIELIYQIAITLHFLHSLNIAHRDLKPDNIMFRTPPDSKMQPLPILIDFGLAGKRRTKPEVDAATLRYASPERVKHLITQKARYEPTVPGQADNSKSDVWALGIIAWELLANCYPFKETKDPEELAYSTVNDQPQLGRNAKIPKNLEKLLRVMLHKDWQQRFSIDETIHALETEIEYLAPRISS